MKQASLGCVVSSRPVWATVRTCLKNTNKQKNIHLPMTDKILEHVQGGENTEVDDLGE